MLKFSFSVYPKKWCQFSKKLLWYHFKLAASPGNRQTKFQKNSAEKKNSK